MRKDMKWQASFLFSFLFSNLCCYYAIFLLGAILDPRVSAGALGNMKLKMCGLDQF